MDILQPYYMTTTPIIYVILDSWDVLFFLLVFYFELEYKYGRCLFPEQATFALKNIYTVHFVLSLRLKVPRLSTRVHWQFLNKM